MRTQKVSRPPRVRKGKTNVCLGLLAFLVVVVAIGLSSCSGYTSNAQSTNGGGTGGASTGVLTPSPASLGFGNVGVGSTATLTLSVSNTGTDTVNISSASISGGVFTVISGSGSATLAAGQTDTVQVQFAPTSITPATGTLTVTSDASNPSLAIALSGTGLQAQISANPASVNFGGIAIGYTDSIPIILKNTGNQTLTFSQVSVSGSGFGQTGLSTSTTIAAGATTTFNATFDPSAAGTANGSITLATNGSPSPLVISLSGAGQATSLLLGTSPTTLAFGNVLNQSSSQKTVSVTNGGNANVTISGVTVTGAGFTASGVVNGTVLTPGQSVTLTVTFAPTSGGAVGGANVSIASNATNSPAVVSLSGTGMHSVVLTWNASPTGGVTYNVFRGASPGSEGTTPINTSPVNLLTFTDTNVTPGGNYYYTVEAVNSAGSSAPSNEAPAAIPNP
ncbi:MAG TPA: choice-of-anchor D domain-containing protein [Candidatus Acidoferrales bacterium]|nr:choice-of-anchor D domain-containing protein [Candidatus Acidoferrales bacterium]